MDYREALQRIEPESCHGDPNLLLSRMDEPWPGMDEDISLGREILVRHLMSSEQNRVPLVGTLSSDGQSVNVADWVMEIVEKFSAEYPDADECEFRTKKTLSVIQGELLPPDTQ